MKNRDRLVIAFRGLTSDKKYFFMLLAINIITLLVLLVFAGYGLSLDKTAHSILNENVLDRTIVARGGDVNKRYPILRDELAEYKTIASVDVDNTAMLMCKGEIIVFL